MEPSYLLLQLTSLRENVHNGKQEQELEDFKKEAVSAAVKFGQVNFFLSLITFQYYLVLWLMQNRLALNQSFQFFKNYDMFV